MKGFFVTGTDTEVGKTWVSASLIAWLRQQQVPIVGVKPISAGCEWLDGQWCNEDALLLQAAAEHQLSYAEVNPVALVPPIAPHIAARDAGVVLSAQALAAHCQQLAKDHPRLLVEGAGGWAVPLNEQDTYAQVAERLQLPVILVVGLRLGCLNHALLTAQAIEQQGLTLAGWVANHLSAEMPYVDDNIATLSGRIAAPCLAQIPYQPHAEALTLQVDWASEALLGWL